MKKPIITLFISAMIILSSTINVAGETVTTELNKTKGDPTFTSIARMSDEGMENDHIYSFSDGEINPNYGEPILMLNGTFYANTPIVRKHGALLVPLRAVAEALGADVLWSDENKTITIQYDGLNIEIKKGRYEAYEIFTSNTEGRQGYLEPVNIDGRFYVSVLTIGYYFNLDIGYISGHDIFIGHHIASNPVVWLDSPVTQSFYEKASNDEFQKLKLWFTECVEYGETEFAGMEYYEELFNSEVPQIKRDIENMKYIGQAGRYALYKCSDRRPYIILLDMYTRDIYVNKTGNGYEVIFKVDANGYNLIRSIYLAE